MRFDLALFTNPISLMAGEILIAPMVLVGKPLCKSTEPVQPVQTGIRTDDTGAVLVPDINREKPRIFIIDDTLCFAV
jgi:hypothetical protein